MIEFDIKKARQEAEREVREEQIKAAKDKIKKKLKELASAKIVVKNIEKELEYLEVEIGKESI
jgi:hypothetical protein